MQSTRVKASGFSAPLVSAVIPARDAEPYLSRAIDSALAQTYTPLEVIVIDDGSRDCTSAVASRYSDRLQLIRLPQSLGAAAARNVGIEAARGAFVAFLDADDEWLREKTARQMAEIAGHMDMTLVGCVAALITSCPGAPAIVNDGRPFATGREAWKTLLAYSFAATSCIIARRADIIRAGGFDTSLPIAEDQDLWIRLARRGEVGFIDEILVRYHDTPQSLTKRHRAEIASRTLAVVERHIAAAGETLTAPERRQIRGHRYARLGRSAYANGDIGGGAALVLRAAALGHQPLISIAYLALAAPPLRPLKRWLKRLFYRESTSRNPGE